VLERIRSLKKILPQIGVGILIFFMLVTPWIIGLSLEDGTHALRVYLLQNTLGRMLPSAIRHYSGGHQHPFFYYFGKLPQDFIPWILAIPAMIVFLISSQPCPGSMTKKRCLQVLGLFVFGFLLLSLPGTKRGIYLTPLYPLLAIGMGAWIAHLRKDESHISNLDRYTLYILMGLFALVPLGVALGSLFIVMTGIGPRGIPMAPVITRLTPLLALIVPFGIISFLFLAYKLLRAYKTKTIPSMALLFTTALLCLIAYHEGAVRIMDPVKNIHRFPNKMKPFLHENSLIAGFRVSELTRAMIPFDTGKYIQTYNDPKKLISFLSRHPNALLVIPERKAKTLPVSLRNRLQLLTKQDYSRNFKIHLYRVRRSTYQSPLAPPNPQRPKQTHPGGKSSDLI
jgi:hypothetical protein